MTGAPRKEHEDERAGAELRYSAKRKRFYPVRSVTDRFWASIDKTAGCWEWLPRRQPDGYARIWIPGDVGAPGRSMPAHRYAYELLVGPVPDGLELDHLCRNRGCVNPEHLEPVTAQVNVLRGTSFAAANARKTHCIHGHEFTPENTKLRPGGRACRACQRASNQACRARKAAGQ